MELQKKKRPLNISGFTLLELIVVLFLITLIAAFSVVAFSGSLSAGNLDASARELVALMKHARTLSLVKGEMQFVVIDLDAGTYGLEGKGSKRFSKDITVSVIDPLSGEMKHGRHFLVFNPLGTIEAKEILLSSRKKALIVRGDPVVGASVEKKAVR